MGEAVSGTASGYHSMRVAQYARHLAKRAYARYAETMGPVYENYLRALKGIWDPQLREAMSKRLESIRGQMTGTEKTYMGGLASRGMTGGPTLAAMRKLREAEASQEAGAWSEMELANYLEAMQGVSNYAANLANLTLSGGQMALGAAAMAQPGQGMGAGVNTALNAMRNYQALQALKGGSMYGDPSMYWGQYNVPYQSGMMGQETGGGTPGGGYESSGYFWYD